MTTTWSQHVAAVAYPDPSTAAPPHRPTAHARWELNMLADFFRHQWHKDHKRIVNAHGYHWYWMKPMGLAAWHPRNCADFLILRLWTEDSYHLYIDNERMVRVYAETFIDEPDYRNSWRIYQATQSAAESTILGFAPGADGDWGHAGEHARQFEWCVLGSHPGVRGCPHPHGDHCAHDYSPPLTDLRGPHPTRGSLDPGGHIGTHAVDYELTSSTPTSSTPAPGCSNQGNQHILPKSSSPPSPVKVPPLVKVPLPFPARVPPPVKVQPPVKAGPIYPPASNYRGNPANQSADISEAENVCRFVYKLNRLRADVVQHCDRISNMYLDISKPHCSREELGRIVPDKAVVTVEDLFMSLSGIPRDRRIARLTAVAITAVPEAGSTEHHAAFGFGASRPSECSPSREPHIPKARGASHSARGNVSIEPSRSHPKAAALVAIIYNARQSLQVHNGASQQSERRHGARRA
ncbi:Uu.00g135860.m01.CDS01 [Anthostomella pinea]|uniref:Uu.00g135860.m01.CDS01 n=1 Tax=Anthostomella pinea TaxID=933095 RepID=A0AAI8VP64_9PEZI|nr:Uu.00g135860.m01.CDS01 [Anthostomella pinea]